MITTYTKTDNTERMLARLRKFIRSLCSTTSTRPLDSAVAIEGENASDCGKTTDSASLAPKLVVLTSAASAALNNAAVISQELGALRRDIASIRTDMTTFALRLGGGDEIDAVALEASAQSAKLLSSAIEGRASLTMQMANAISDIAGAGTAEAREDLAKINLEFNELRNDARRADALRRGIIPFAGGEGTHSVLSVLAGAHSIGQGIFSFLTMIDSNNVRPVCQEFRLAIMNFPWMDVESKIKGSVKAWRAAFPFARAVNVSNRKDIVDADFLHIRGGARTRLHTVNMSKCRNVSDEAFIYLRKIHTLHMRECRQSSITSAAFLHLQGIHTLIMRGCHQRTITDTAFVHLCGIHTLDMRDCKQATITDAAFVYLQGIHTLDMGGCTQATITDAAFANLRGIHTLDMGCCTQATITDAAFANLRGINTLDMRYCRQAAITDTAFTHLIGINSLNMANCHQVGITDAAFVNLQGIHTLDMGGCNQETITNAAFEYLKGIHTLYISFCNQITITDAAFVHLRGIHSLGMRFCTQATLTDAAFIHLSGIHTLCISDCRQFTNAAFGHLRGIHTLYMNSCNQETITDAAFEQLQCLRMLFIDNCYQINTAALKDIVQLPQAVEER